MMIPISRVLLAVVAGSFICSGAFAQNADRADQANIQGLIEELSVLIERGASSRAADRRFLDELRDFIDDYDRPWTSRVVVDEFRDGDYTAGPVWTVTSGQFRVDRRYGLVASPTRTSRSSSSGGSKDLAAALIGQLLKQQSNRGAAPTAVSAANIQAAARTANTFALEVTLSGIGNEADAEIAMLQGASGATGYALVVRTGEQAGVFIERLSSRGRSTVGRSDGALRTDASGTLQLDWTRGRNGKMRVKHEGNTLVETVDRGLRDGFARISITARGGEIGLRRIAVSTTP
ncbi:MAG: hypothetical protein HOI95_24780 [Chromatiales bacterium]|jgi:hypothetical protein|nr:hypothetical protein [Chromatiales bacterium]